MRALILDAGPSSRSAETAEQQPKYLVPLAGKPLIVRQMAALRGGGVTEFGIAGPRETKVTAAPDMICFINERWAETNSVMSLAAAAAWLRTGPVIVSSANIFYPRDLVRRLASVRGSLVVGYDRQWRDLWTRRFADPLSHAETFRRSASGNLLEIGGKATDINAIDGRSMGLLKFAPNGWQAVEALLAELDAPTRDRLDITGLLQRLLVKTVSIGTVGTDGQWGEIDDPADVALYERMAAAGELTLED